jgi:transposase-like protein
MEFPDTGPEWNGFDRMENSHGQRRRGQGLERENAELRMKNEFLGKAAAFFARDYR